MDNVRLQNTLETSIEAKYHSLIRVTNSELIATFWKIGNEINQHFNSRTDENDYWIETISGELADLYGPYFNLEQLRLMLRFASEFSNGSAISQITPFLSWEYLSYIIQARDLETMLSYITLAVNKGIDIQNLKKTVDDPNLHGTARGVGKGKNLINLYVVGNFTYELIPSLDKPYHDHLIKDFFKNTETLSFSHLLQNTKGKKATPEQVKSLSSEVEDTFAQSVAYIEQFQHWVNRWLNYEVNKLFWEVGALLHQNFLEHQVNDEEEVIKEVSFFLEKKYGTNFSAQQLQSMLSFHRQIPDEVVVFAFANLVRWEHIVVLLSVPELEAKLFYARLAAVEGSTEDALKKAIALKQFENTHGAKEAQLQALNLMREPIEARTWTEEVENGSIIQTEYIDNTENIDSKLVTNIFENRYFFDFVSRF